MLVVRLLEIREGAEEYTCVTCHGFYFLIMYLLIPGMKKDNLLDSHIIFTDSSVRACGWGQSYEQNTPTRMPARIYE